MAQQGGFLFRIGYCLYVNTRFGHWYHGRDIKKAREQFEKGHSVCTPFSSGDLRILPIPVSMDNYAYYITDLLDGTSVLVDPSDSVSILEFLNLQKSEGEGSSQWPVAPAAVLTTHKHWDHSGANEALSQKFPQMEIHGSAACPGVTVPHCEDETISFGRLSFKVLQTPGHTTDHIVYVLDGAPFSAPSSLFSGDLLFLGGIGRMFECSAERMLKSLDLLISTLPDETLVWPGHEYTKNNLEFAAHLEPSHNPTRLKHEWAAEKRKQNLSTVPGTIGEEKCHNPYLRTREPSLRQALQVSPSPSFLREYGENGSAPPTDEQRAAMLLEIRRKKDLYKYIQ